MTQLALFDVLHAPPVIISVNPDGPVLRGDPDETLALPHPRLAWNRAQIELHRHENGLWMWSTCWQCGNAGSGYRVGEKWGKFAQSRDDALFYAKREISSRLKGSLGIEAEKILLWLETL